MAVQAIGAVLVILVLANTLSAYWLFLASTAVISAISLLGLGVVSGNAGMISLCQMSFAAVGGWVVARLNEASAPGGLLVWVLLGGVAALPFGLAVGLPALRLRGIHLAVVTLGFAAACDSVLGQIGFPGSDQYLPVARPQVFDSDRSYFVLVGLALVVVVALLDVLRRQRMGAAWRTARYSERATASNGYSVARTKLSAFAVSAFVAGISGGLLAGQVGLLSAQSFTISQSLVVYVLAVMLGVQYVDGAVLAGVIGVLITEVLARLHLNQNWSGIVFGAGAFQALASGRSLSEDIRLRRAARRSSRPAPVTARIPRGSAPAGHVAVAGTTPALEVRGLTVRYGSVTALDGVDLTVPVGTVMGLIGPNGAGKSTFTDAVSGFIAEARGEVRLAGVALDGRPVRARALAGLRRSYQQDRVPPSLTVGEYLRFACHGKATREEMLSMLAYFECPAPEVSVTQLDVGTRRVLEIAGMLLSRPSVMILDEPAAGLGHEESLRLGQRLAEVPARFGASILLIEHDLDLVRAACSSVTVLNFGSVIAVGEPAAVLASGEVTRAYVGEEVVSS
jgi:branched-chain amino acid transport system permease protein